MTLADATPSLPDWRRYTKRLTSSRERRFVCLSDHYVITWQWTACTIAKSAFERGLHWMQYGCLVLSDKPYARSKPPTYLHYGIKFYFLQTPLSTTLILLKSEKTDTEFPRRWISLRYQLARNVPLEILFARNTGKKQNEILRGFEGL
jgi:hypothetical protein